MSAVVPPWYRMHSPIRPNRSSLGDGGDGGGGRRTYLQVALAVRSPNSRGLLLGPRLADGPRVRVSRLRGNGLIEERTDSQGAAYAGSQLQTQDSRQRPSIGAQPCARLRVPRVSRPRHRLAQPACRRPIPRAPGPLDPRPRWARPPPHRSRGFLAIWRTGMGCAHGS